MNARTAQPVAPATNIKRVWPLAGLCCVGLLGLMIASTIVLALIPLYLQNKRVTVNNNNIKCSADMIYLSTVTQITIPTTLLSFVSIVGDFFNSTWYSYPTKSSIGQKNQIGSIRTISDTTDTLVFHETLIKYQLNQLSFTEIWQGPGEQIKSVNFGNFILGSYTEYIIGQSICQGYAVRIDFGIDCCVTNITTAKRVLDDGHVIGIQQIQQLLGIGNFTTCDAARTTIDKYK